MRYLAALLLALLAAPLSGQASRDFDSTDRIDADGCTVTAAPLTLAAWVKIDDVSAARVIQWSGDNNATWRAFYISADTTSKFLATTVQANTFEHATQSDTFSTGTWYFVAGVFASATDRKVFVNAVEKGSNTNSSTPTLIVQYEIGDNSFGSVTPDHKIAWAHVYTRALSAVELAEIMYKPGSITRDLKCLHALWGESFVDLSGNGNAGSNTGSVAISDGPPVMIAGGGGQ